MKFQSPRCRGSMSNERVSYGHGHLIVSIPAMPGQHVELPTERTTMKVCTRVSIPAMPGQHVERRTNVTAGMRLGRFNPRDAGAACRTRILAVLHSSRLASFNPRDAGAACRTPDNPNRSMMKRTVSIPAMPGQHVEHYMREEGKPAGESFNPRDAGAACRTTCKA